MARKQFDATLKDISGAYPADWAALLGATSVRSVRLVDADASTVTAAADKVMMIDSGSGPEWILHPELQSGRDLDLPHNTWWYNSVFHHRHRCVVRSVVMLLRRAADGPDLNGEYKLDPDGYNVFRYRVIRLWELPVEQLLAGGIGTLPLATLTDDANVALPQVVARIDQRIRAEALGEEARKLRATTAILMGLRHRMELIEQMMQGANMRWEKIYEDSVVVQELIRQHTRVAEQRGEERGEQRGEQRGAVAHTQKSLLRQGTFKFGEPGEETRAIINSIDDLARLDAMSDRLLSATSWAELLAANGD